MRRDPELLTVEECRATPRNSSATWATTAATKNSLTPNAPSSAGSGRVRGAGDPKVADDSGVADSADAWHHCPMSTVQLISELKALPARERARVIRAATPATNLAGRAAGRRKNPKARVIWPDLAELKRKVYGDRLLPNLVLLEREETRC